MESQAMPPPRRRWPQFSLRTAFLSLLMIATVLSIGVSVRQFGQIKWLREENKRLRNEVGEIKIEEGDEEKLHAVAVPNLEPMTWKWRVHVPSDRGFYVDAVVNEIPKLGDQKEGTKLSMHSGESVVTFALRKDERGDWTWIFTSDGLGGSSGASPAIVELVEARSRQFTSTHVTALLVIEPGNDLDLLRLRFVPGPTSVSSKELANPGPGVWVRVREGKLN